MTIAFYAPLKPHDHPIPSGDRRMAGLLLDALHLIDQKVQVVSRLRAYEGQGDRGIQEAIRHKAITEADKYLKSGHKPKIWLTYHLYHKAPDWIGPRIARALDIPYWVAEASFAPKQAGGPWASGHEAVADALRLADGVIQLNPTDRGCVEPMLKPGAAIVDIAPFVDPAPYERATRHKGSLRREIAGTLGIDPGLPWVVTVAMMRPGDKTASYKSLFKSLKNLTDIPFAHMIIGDGPTADEIKIIYKNRPETYFLGSKSEVDLRAFLAAADIFAWPGLNEAFGLALLEAQASALPVVSADRPGIAGMIRHGETGLLVPEGDIDAMSDALRHLLGDTDLRHRVGANALKKVSQEHSLTSAADRLRDALNLREQPQ